MSGHWRGAARAEIEAQRGPPLPNTPERALDLFDAVIDLLPDAVVVVDQTSAIVLANAQAGLMFGYPVDELRGTPVDRLLPERLRDLHREHRSDYDRAPRLRLMGSGIGLVAARRDATEFPVEVSLSPIETSAGTVVICAIRDVSVQRASQQSADQTRLATARTANERLVVSALQAQVVAEKAEQDSHLKDEFLATVAHELRTPLSAILGWARILESKHLLPERADHAAAAIGRSAAALAHMIDDLLDTSRVLRGAIRLTVQPVDLAAVARVAIDAVGPLAVAQHVDLTLDAVAGSPMVSGDADRLQQVIWNLLANAIKFTPDGGRVHVRVEHVGDHMQLTVADTGRGISADFLPHVFERYRQSEDATTRRHSGLGLGLSIVVQLVELHGGTVSAASEGLGCGATFSIRLPIAVDDDRAPRVADPSAPSSGPFSG